MTREPDAWRWGVGRWEAYFALVLVSTVIYVLAGGEAWQRDAVAAVLLVALAPWYLLLGRRSADRAARPRRPWATWQGRSCCRGPRRSRPRRAPWCCSRCARRRS
ncbi:hypothetical protein [Actinomadura keratinilytica]|uniref:hypothetical protein n=1 Tax=Actinomadura keratinilytica TaxID=547461 RepID=UPI003612A04E